MLSLGQPSLPLFFARKALDPTSIYPTVITCHSQLQLSPHQTVSSMSGAESILSSPVVPILGTEPGAEQCSAYSVE